MINCDLTGLILQGHGMLLGGFMLFFKKPSSCFIPERVGQLLKAQVLCFPFFPRRTICFNDGSDGKRFAYCLL